MGQLTGSGPGHGHNYVMVDNSVDGVEDGRLWTNSIIEQVIPTDPSQNNPEVDFEYIVSGTATGVTGSRIGTIIQTIGTGSYVTTLTYANNRLTNIGSWS